MFQPHAFIALLVPTYSEIPAEIIDPKDTLSARYIDPIQWFLVVFDTERLSATKPHDVCVELFALTKTQQGRLRGARANHSDPLIYDTRERSH